AARLIAARLVALAVALSIPLSVLLIGLQVARLLLIRALLLPRPGLLAGLVSALPVLPALPRTPASQIIHLAPQRAELRHELLVRIRRRALALHGLAVREIARLARALLQIPQGGRRDGVRRGNLAGIAAPDRVAAGHQSCTGLRLLHFGQ